MRNILLVSFLLLCSCTDSSVKVICPSLVTYTNTQQKDLYTDIKNNKISSNGIEWLEDYINLRDQVRACKNGL